MSQHAALYAWFSKQDHALRSRVNDLLDLASRCGCDIVATLGGEGTDEPGTPGDGSDLANLAHGIGRPDVGIVMGWTTDSLGRSHQHLVITPKGDALAAM